MIKDEISEFAEIPALCIFEHEPGEDPHDVAALDNIVENFSVAGSPGRIKRVLGQDSYNPFVISHRENTGEPAIGWPQRLWRDGLKLYAHVKHVPLDVKRSIENKAYRSISSEIYSNFRGKVGPALRRICLMGATVPAKKNLGEIAFAQYSESDGEFKTFTRFQEDLSMVDPKDAEKMSLEELRAALQTSEADLSAEKLKFSEKNKDDSKVATANALALEELKKKNEALEKDKVGRYLELERGKNTSAAAQLIQEQQEKEALALTVGELRQSVSELEAKNTAVEINRFSDRFQHDKGIHDEGAIKTVKETLFGLAVNKFAEGDTPVKSVMRMMNAITPQVTQPGISIVLDEGLNFDENEAKEAAEYTKWAETEDMTDDEAKKYSLDWWKKNVRKA